MLHDLIGLSEPDGTPGPGLDRILGLGKPFMDARKRLPELCELAIEGLARMALPDLHFPHTMRGIGSRNGGGTEPVGDNLRYTINVAQGLAWTPLPVQRNVLGGPSAADLALSCIDRAAKSGEPGAIALAAWAAAEVAGVFAADLFTQLEEYLGHDKVVQTVPCAWALTAALAARHLGKTAEVQRRASRLLLYSQSSHGLFGHLIPASAGGFGRRHVGCFADQVYPIQALARLAHADDDRVALRTAEACAARIVELQGDAGQWWWHYDTRDGSVVESYPVYSVHQHAMAPMALLDLYDAGGTDYRDAVIKGLLWIDKRPETNEPVVSPEDSVIWRKVGRNEPRKLVRSIAAVTTGLRAGLHLPGINMAFPPGRIDRECRPYEFGWLLYAWRSRGVVQALRR